MSRVRAGGGEGVRRRLAIGMLGIVAAAAAAVSGCHWRNPLTNPWPKELRAAAPDSFLVEVETSRGTFDVMGRRDWAPLGVDRFYYLVRHHYYDGARFFRVVKGFVAQFGISGDPAVNAVWRGRAIPDEPVRHTNARGTIAFARAGPATRTVQLYVNLKSNARLDSLSGFGFPPIAEVMRGMAVVDSLYGGYGEGMPRGRGPSQDSIETKGNAYLARAFPRLDSIVTMRVVRSWK